MKSRESASAQAESAKGAVARPEQGEKSDPLLQRYLGAALFKTIGVSGRRREPSVSSKRV